MFTELKNDQDLIQKYISVSSKNTTEIQLPPNRLTVSAFIFGTKSRIPSHTDANAKMMTCYMQCCHHGFMQHDCAGFQQVTYLSFQKRTCPRKLIYFKYNLMHLTGCAYCYFSPLSTCSFTVK